MTFDQIQTLDLIVKYGSFKSASEVMHKSQPSLSMAIKKLEEEFGIELFDRSGYRPVLTEQGKAFHKKSLQTLEQFQNLETLARELGAGFESEISICTDAIFPICHISKILENFFEPHISTTLNLSTDVLEGVISRLMSHEVDFALGPDIFDAKDIEKIKILDAIVVPVIGKKHTEIDLNLLKTLPQIIVSSSVKEKRGVVRRSLSNQFWHTTDFSMKEQLIESGLGWGSLPLHQIADQLESGVLVEIKDIPEMQRQSVPMFLLRSKSKVMGPNTKNLWNYLAKIGVEK